MAIARAGCVNLELKCRNNGNADCCFIITVKYIFNHIIEAISILNVLSRCKQIKLGTQRATCVDRDLLLCPTLHETDN